MQDLFQALNACHFDKSDLKQIVPLDGAHLLINNEQWLNFASHDYLGLSQHKEIKKSSMRALLQEGVGLSSSYLAYGRLQSQLDLENKLVAITGKEATLLASSREHAQALLLTALINPSSLIFIPEKQSLPSYLQGARSFFYREHLKQLLHQSQDIPAFSKIILADFPNAFDSSLIELAETYHAWIYVDVSAVFGVIDLPLLSHPNHLLMSSFEYGCGSSGAFIGCSQSIKNYLLSFYPFEFTLPPPTLGSLDAALEILPQMEGERRQLEQRAFWLRKKAQELGLVALPSPPHFVTFAIPEDSCLPHLLKEHHILAQLQKESVTFIINTHHNLEHLHQLLKIFHLWSRTYLESLRVCKIGSNPSDKALEVAIQSATETPER